MIYITYCKCSVHDIPLVSLPKDVNGNVQVVKLVKCIIKYVDNE